MILKVLCMAHILFHACRVCSQELKISESKYDYSVIAEQITRGCPTQYEQAEAIYRWICKNIAYDTEHKTHTADECWDNRKGVCQAYCELFYRLGEPLGLKCRIITGISKNDDGTVSQEGHAWLYIETENGGILADPTWGAGGVKNGRFVRSTDPMIWFHVDPHWMIFTHYPDNAVFQFISDTVDVKTFAEMPSLKPSLGSYGLSGEKIRLQYAENEDFSLPRIYSGHRKEIHLTDIPLQSVLRPGQSYTFKIGKKTTRGMALIHGEDFIREQDWEQEDSCYTIRYTPTSGGTLSIAMMRDEGDYSIAIEYDVAEPTTEELATIEREHPYKMPEMKQIENLYPKRLQAIGIEGSEVLREAREGRLSVMVTLYKDAEARIKDAKIPLSRLMQIGKSYRLAIKPRTESNWAIFLNGKLHDRMILDITTGWHTIEITPNKEGILSVNMESPDGRYYRVLEYSVK